MELLGRLRRAVKKLTFLLNLKRFLTDSTWQLASLIRARTPAITGPNRWRRRAFSFNDRPGLRACVEVLVIDDQLIYNSPTHDYNINYDYDDEDPDNSRRSYCSSGTTSPHPLRRTTSNPLETDVDKHAEMFIDNFYRHLLYEKQVSLNLRYCRPDTNSFTSSADDTTVSPLSSASPQLNLFVDVQPSK